MEPKIVEDALHCSERNLAVIPLWWVVDGRCGCRNPHCNSPGKHPIGKLVPHGVQDATKNPEKIREWWTAYPKANIGIATGKPSDTVVLDVDPRNGGDESLALLEDKHGKFVGTYRVRTGGGGEHHYFMYSDELLRMLKKVTKGLPGLDVQADGKYVLAAGSTHASGKRYELLSSPLAAFEPRLFRPQPEKGEAAAGERENEVSPAFREMAQRRLAKECEKLAVTEKGNRDNQENTSGFIMGRFVSAGAIGYDAAFQRLFEAARSMKEPHLDDEIRKKLEHGLKDGMEKPFPDPTRAGYVISRGEMCFLKERDGHRIPTSLCNFSAEIVEEVIQDDGAETTRVFVLEGALGDSRPLPRVQVPAARFSGMGWVPELWGHAAVISAGFSAKDRLREAIQRLSPHAEIRHVFIHTGWRLIDGKWVFLTSSGAVGMEEVQVALGTGLDRYQLPLQPQAPAEAMKVSLRLLDMAPDTVTVPLFAAMFRAVLAHAFPADFSIHLEGHTGAGKSTLVGLFLSHFGDFDEKHLPGGWNSTANALERQAFLLKDVPFAIDDYAPPPLKKREFESKFGLVMRAQGNLQGRARMRPDASLRPTYAPRGLIISTGETHPPGQSLLARTLVLELERNEINFEIVSEAQQRKDVLAHAMAGYIAWLAPQMSSLRKELEGIFKERRALATVKGEHLRIPGTVAHLWLGVEMALRYAEAVGALSSEEAGAYRDRCWNALTAQAREQAQVVERERPTLRFLTVLDSLAHQRRAFFIPKGSNEEEFDPKWHRLVMGWYDDDNLFLDPETAVSAVIKECHAQGEPFPTYRHSLARDLNREGLMSAVNKGRNQHMVRLGNRQRRVWCLGRKAVNALLGQEFPALPPPKDQRDFSDSEEF
ncbi:MAG: bifunctional DNA primase/polymerase [Acidobacteria bacterium]|nr:bifunctional DNA primase/polymerase [Acidobacteriota bacterium]